MANDTMRAAVLVTPGRIELREVKRPACGPADVIVQVERCGICGTDVHIFKGHYASDRLPLIPGHEFAGRIMERGRDVRGLAEGERVIADINVGCGTCFYCRHNEVLNCPDVVQLGIHADGAFAEYVRVPARLAIPIPAGMSFALAALTEPLACVVRAAKSARLRFAESVLVLGAGPVGNLHVQLARAVGAAPVIAAERDPRRAALVRACGADAVVEDPARLRETVLAMTEGRGADLVIESVGSVALYEEALRLVRPGGRVAAFGLTGPEARVAVAPLDFVLKEIGLAGSVAGMGEDMHQALRLLAHGRIDAAPFLQDVRPLDALQDAIATVAAWPQALKTQIAVAP